LRVLNKETYFSQTGRKTPKILYFIVIKFAKSLRKWATIVENSKQIANMAEKRQGYHPHYSHLAMSPLDHFDCQTKKVVN
jgi:hypothetical protein